MSVSAVWGQVRGAVQAKSGRGEAAQRGRPLRVALVVGTLEVGGTERQVCRLAEELRDRGVAVRIFVQTAGGPLESALRSVNLDYRVYGFEGLRIRGGKPWMRPMNTALELRPIAMLWWDLWRWKPDVCQAYLFQACLWGMMGAWVAGVPLRIACHRGLARDDITSRTGRYLVACAHAATTVHLANSDAVAKSVHEVWSVPVSDVRVIANGVDVPGVSAEVDREPPVAMMVANFIRYKGHVDVVHALDLIDDPPCVRLVGAGPELEAISKQLAVTGLDSVVEIVGRVPDAATLWKDVQFGILASHEEGLPNAILEAMAYGVPMVATRVGGVPDLIEDGVNGLLVSPRDPQALAIAIDRLRRSPTLRLQLGRRAKERAVRWSWSNCVDAHMALYREMLPSARAGRFSSRYVPGANTRSACLDWPTIDAKVGANAHPT